MTPPLRPLQPHQQRVVDERTELVEKLGKLDKFIDGDVFDTLPPEDQKLLEVQQSLMTHYAKILDQRIARF